MGCLRSGISVLDLEGLGSRVGVQVGQSSNLDFRVQKLQGVCGLAFRKTVRVYGDYKLGDGLGLPIKDFTEFVVSLRNPICIRL